MKAGNSLGETTFAREDCDYTPFYCEENVARLLARLISNPPLGKGHFWAVLVSNPAKAVAMLGQRAGRGDSGFVMWDYHAVALAKDDAGKSALVLDLDSLLDFPAPALRWAQASFPAEAKAQTRPFFRLVPAAEYVETLASDRSHMRRADGSWAAPPPPWPPFGRGRANNLFELLDMSRNLPGFVLDRDEFLAFCSGPGRPAAE